MTADERKRDDLKRHAQFVLASLGAAALLGSLVGAMYGAARDVVGMWTADCVDDC